MAERDSKILSFLKEIEKFKLIERRVYCSDLKRKESDAEHSWHLAMFIILFEKDIAKNLDIAKMLKMALIHDLAEIENIAKMIKGAESYFLQRFNNKNTFDPSFRLEKTFTDAELKTMKKSALKYVKNCQVRG